MGYSGGALSGIKAVCITMFQQGPKCFSHFADLGAEVIKIEPPLTGEQGRILFKKPDFPINGYFEENNRGVKCITVNIKHPKGTEIIYKLVADADIFAQNFRPGVAERNHFAYEDLIKVNPKIVYLSMSAYGPDGPNAGLPGTDGCAQAAGGICSNYGEEGSFKATGPISVADETGALTNFAGALVGLLHARMTGEGQKIDTSLLGSQVRLMGHSLTRYLLTGDLSPGGRSSFRRGRAPGITASFVDKNGKHFMFQVTGEERWHKGAVAIGADTLLASAGCGKLEDVVQHKDKQPDFLKILDDLFATNTREYWLKLIRGADVISAPINNLADLALDADVLANKYIVEIDHPKLGKIRENGHPWKFSKTPARAGVAPELGEHTTEVLANLGYSSDEIKGLKDDGTI